MPIAPNTSFDHYEILAPLGKGGMGEVYRAKDTRLNREVAIKVLPGEFAHDADRLRRFEQEALATSALNHPNILTVYDFGEFEGNPFLVMELLDGEELRAQLDEGVLPVRKAIDYAQQMAAGLAAAHEKGIVHRDLKPENLFITKDGRLKILDFGLAKLRPPRTVSAGSDVATQKQLTNPGSVMGTVAYMSPEQVRGQDLDHRSDIFSFGLILFEMLSGQRAFTGELMADVMSAIMRDDPPELSETNAKISPALDKIVRRCLEKKPEMRFHSASDLGFALSTLTTPSGSRVETALALPMLTESLPATGTARLFGNARLAWVTAAVVLLVSLFSLPFAVKYLRQAPPTEAITMRFTIAPPEKATNIGRPVISPDGRSLIFIATMEGKRQIWLRPVNGFTAQPIAGTEGIQASPFWSPDSRSIGFSSDGKLKRIEVTGGAAQTICDLSGRIVSGAWGSSGTIVIYGRDVIYQVPATGGELKPAVSYGGPRPTNVTIRPYFLPDGRHFLHYAGVTQEAGIYLASLDDKESKRLLAADSDGIYAPSTTQPEKGWLLFLRLGVLLAQPLDAHQLTLTGEPFTVAEQVEPGSFSVSNTGILTYLSRHSYENVQLGWIDRAGKPLELIGATGFALEPKLSPDGKRVAVMRMDAKTGTVDISVIDLTRNTESRLTFDPAGDGSPVWSPDGSRIVWYSNRGQSHHLYQKLASGIGQEEQVLQSDITITPSSWSADDKFLLYIQSDPKTLEDIWVLPLDGDRKPFPFLQTQFAESGAQFSPTGAHVAYTSNESGKSEVYVQTFPAGGGKWQVSTGGGSSPQWRGDGKELYYLSANGRMIAVEVKGGATFEVGLPKVLFELAAAQVQRNTFTVTADGQRFLFPRQLRENVTVPFSVVVNWTAEAKR